MPQEATRSLERDFVSTIADPANFPSPLFDAFDDAGNLYVDNGTTSANKVVGKITGGCKAKKILLLATTNSIGVGSTVQIDKADRIAILDATPNASVIDTYNPPTKGSLGNSVSVTPLMSAPKTFAFLASGRDVYVADGTDDTANEYDYAVSAPRENSISVGGIVLNVAVTPPLVP